jgi:hypothetical protein
MKTYKKDYASVLALNKKGRRVSFGEAWRILGLTELEPMRHDACVLMEEQGN